MIGQLFTCQWVAIVSTVNFPFRKWVLQKHYKSLACVDLGFSQRREGLPPANMPYAEHSACNLTLFSAASGDSAKGPAPCRGSQLCRRGSDTGLVFLLWHHADCSLPKWRRRLCQVDGHTADSACHPPLPHSCCPLRRAREKRRGFWVSPLSLTLIARELFCEMNSIFP